MNKIGVLSLLLAAAVTLAPLGAAAKEFRDDPREDDESMSLASPNYPGYRPAWANPYAEPEELGVNDDPTPFDPADVDSGPSPLDPDAF
jgi:hypothetical protein